MGNRWDYSYNVWVDPVGADVVLANGVGRRDTFRLQPDGSFAKADTFLRITKEPDGSFAVTFPSREVWTFVPFDFSAAQGRLRRITDRNGNELRFEYDELGRLSGILDTLGRAHKIAYNTNGYIESFTDFTGRSVRYSYYDAEDIDSPGAFGDLKSVTTPAVLTGAPGNAFPDGKTTTYTYTRGFADDRLNHLLASKMDPKGQTFLVNTFHETTDPADFRFSRVVTQRWGETNQILHFTYHQVAPVVENGDAVLVAVVNDRMGNVSHHAFDAKHRLVQIARYTGRADPSTFTTLTENRPIHPLRSSDPEFFLHQYTYTEESLPRLEILPNLNAVRLEYESEFNPNAPAETRGNLRRRTRLPSLTAPASEAIVEEFEYAPNFGSCCGSGFLTRYVDGSGNEVRHVYDAAGNRTRTIDRISGVVHDFEYNNFGQRTARIWPPDSSGHRRRDESTYYGSGPMTGQQQSSVLDATGFRLVTTYDYDALGRVTGITDPQGAQVTRLYNELDQLVRTLRPALTNGTSVVRIVTEFFYDANGNTVRRDFSNLDDNQPVPGNPVLTTLYEFDLLNSLTRVTSEVDAARSLTVEFAYDANQNRRRVRSGEAVAGRSTNNVTWIEHDERDLPFRYISAPATPNQSTQQFDYDGNANVIAHLVGLEDNPRVSQLAYDGFDRISVATDAMGNVSRYQYDRNGNRLRHDLEGELIDVPGSVGNVKLNETRRTFDAMDRLVRTDEIFFDPSNPTSQAPGLATTRVIYDFNSLVATNIDALGRVSRFEYDTAHRLQTSTDPAGNSVTREFDANSNTTRITQIDRSLEGEPDETHSSTLEYDALNRVKATVDSLGQVRRHFYNSRDLPIREIDERGNVVLRAYDGLGRLLASSRTLTDTGDGTGTPIATNVVSQTWDDNGRVTSRTDPNGNITRYDYDDLNRPTRTTHADGTSSSVTYDVHGNALVSVDANGTQITQTFDLLNRVLRSDYVVGPGVASDTTLEVRQYDGASRLVRSENNASVILRAHDSVGNLLTESVNGRRIDVIHDLLGQPLVTTYPSGRSVTNTYDAADRLATVADATGILVQYSYIGDRVRDKTLANGTRQRVQYDGRLRPELLVQSRAPHGPAEEFERLTLAWSSTSMKILRNNNLSGGERRELTYDSLDRLVRSSYLAPGAAPEVTAYSLDLAGNRARVGGGPDPGEYRLSPASPAPADAAVNQYTTTPFDTRLYDANGNTTQGPAGASRLTYDAHDRLVRVEQPGVTSVYAYDGLGRRQLKTVTRTNADPRVTRFTYDGWRILEEDDGQGNTLASYAYGAGLDEVLAMDRGGRRAFYHFDDLNQTTHLTDVTGAVLESCEYGDYGEVIVTPIVGPASGDSPAGNPFLFTGRYLDSETGFYEFRTRYLDPASGRFLTRDPIGIWGDESNLGNGYTYAGNSPASRIDPLGLDSYLEQARRTFNNLAEVAGKAGHAIQVHVVQPVVDKVRSEYKQHRIGDSVESVRKVPLIGKPGAIIAETIHVLKRDYVDTRTEDDIPGVSKVKTAYKAYDKAKDTGHAIARKIGDAHRAANSADPTAGAENAHNSFPKVIRDAKKPVDTFIDDHDPSKTVPDALKGKAKDRLKDETIKAAKEGKDDAIRVGRRLLRCKPKK